MSPGDAEPRAASSTSRGGGTAASIALPWILVGVTTGIAIGRAVSSPSDAVPWLGAFVLSPGFAGSVAFLGAAIAANVAWRNSRADRAQRRLADRRSQHWERFAWATDTALTPRTSVVGTKVLGALLESGEATVDDARMTVEVLKVIESAGGARRWRRRSTTRLVTRPES